MLATNTGRRLILGALFALTVAVIAPSSASASVKWLCRPGMAHTPCSGSMKTTVFQGFTKQVRVETPKASKPKIDCFYVYPTVSNQSANVATKAIDPEIHDIALYQAARYASACRIFAPVYRQITVQALSRKPPPTAAEQKIGDADVLEAWKQYLAKYNHGRGVVLIGHSQGSFRLTTLIQKQIDKKPAVRKRLVSAILLGGNITVKKGSDRGGSFQNVPACKRNAQTGCVVAFSSYNATPPANSLFSRTSTAGRQVLCTNPAALGGGSAKLDSIVPSAPFAPGTLIAAGIQILGISYPSVSTPFIESHGAFGGECMNTDGASFLNITSEPGTPVPNPSPDATWGLHLLDANVAQGDLVKLIAAQTKAYLH